MIDCAFYGFLAADADSRISQAGKQWTRLRVGTGKDEQVQWLSVACFGEAAKVAAELKKGHKITARARSASTPGAVMTAGSDMA